MARYFIIINLVLTAIISYAGVSIGYRLLAERLEVPVVAALDAHRPTDKGSAASEKMIRPFRDYQAIVDRDLFKLAVAESVPAEAPKKVDVNKLEKTKLGLKLWGTVAGTTGHPFAVIEETATRKQQLYTTGDAIQTATIKMILRGKVVLEVNGREEVLKIEKTTNRKSRGPVHVAAARVPAAPLQPSPGDGEKILIKRSRIQDAIKNVNELMRYVRIRPHFTNGQPDGLKLTGIRPGSLFTEIGFKSGDIITGVNGKPIQSVDDALQFYSSLKTAGNVNLQLRRRGRSQTIQYRVEDK